MHTQADPVRVRAWLRVPLRAPCVSRWVLLCAAGRARQLLPEGAQLVLRRELRLEIEHVADGRSPFDVP